ncbi:MAG: hypothetical protein ACREGD_03060 [Candidatus Saccharimonadales bacterium]
MSVEQLESGVVSTERLIAIATGDLPAGVFEIDALSDYASGFTPRWSAMSKHAGIPPIYSNGERAITSVEYQQMADRGSRDYWRQDEKGQTALYAIAQGGIPEGYQDLFDGTSGTEGAHDTIRQEAYHLLGLSQEIAAVEHTERENARLAQQAARLATREAARQATFLEETDTVVIPVVKIATQVPTVNARTAEVPGHRADGRQRGKEGLIDRVANFVSNTLDWVGVRFA